MVKQARRCTQNTCRKAVEALSAIVGKIVGATLSFLGKVIGFVAEHTTWALIFVTGLIGVWLKQKVKKG